MPSLWIKNGRVIDPAAKRDETGDVFADDHDTVAVAEAARVVDSLKHLNDIDRQVIVLRYYSGLPFAEIADILGKKEDAVKVRHHRAIEKLQRIFHHGK